MNGSFFLRQAGRCIAVAFRAVPQSHRFTVAVSLGRLIEPLVARTEAWNMRQLLRTDSLRETSLDLVLLMLDRHRVRYDPRVEVIGGEHLEGDAPNGTLVVSPHAMLAAHLTRVLHDRGIPLQVVSPEITQPITGIGRAVRVLMPSPWLLVRARRALRSGEVIAAMIDRGEPERRSVTMQTSSGPLLVSMALLQVAVRQRARIVFLHGRLEERRIVLTLERPSDEASVEAILADFSDFVDRAVHAVALVAPTAGTAARTESALQSAGANTASTS